MITSTSRIHSNSYETLEAYSFNHQESKKSFANSSKETGQMTPQFGGEYQSLALSLPDQT
jgi:hypothetical protein